MLKTTAFVTIFFIIKQSIVWDYFKWRLSEMKHNEKFSFNAGELPITNDLYPFPARAPTFLLSANLELSILLKIEESRQSQCWMLGNPIVWIFLFIQFNLFYTSSGNVIRRYFILVSDQKVKWRFLIRWVWVLLNGNSIELYVNLSFLINTAQSPIIRVILTSRKGCIKVYKHEV